MSARADIKPRANETQHTAANKFKTFQKSSSVSHSSRGHQRQQQRQQRQQQQQQQQITL